MWGVPFMYQVLNKMVIICWFVCSRETSQPTFSTFSNSIYYRGQRNSTTSSVLVTIQIFFPAGIFRKIKFLGGFNFISTVHFLSKWINVRIISFCGLHWIDSKNKKLVWSALDIYELPLSGEIGYFQPSPLLRWINTVSFSIPEKSFLTSLF